MNKAVSCSVFMQTIQNLKALGPEVEFDEYFTTEDYWNSSRTDVVGFIRYYDSGETVYTLTGRK